MERFDQAKGFSSALRTLVRWFKNKGDSRSEVLLWMFDACVFPWFGSFQPILSAQDLISKLLTVEDSSTWWEFGDGSKIKPSIRGSHGSEGML